MDSVRFTDFVFLRRTRQLTRDSTNVPIGSRALDLLDLLLPHRDRVVARNEIMEAAWPDTIAGNNNLNVQVANLRRLLGADALDITSNEVRPPNFPDLPSDVVLPFTSLGGPRPGLACRRLCRGHHDGTVAISRSLRGCPQLGVCLSRNAP